MILLRDLLYSVFTIRISVFILLQVTLRWAGRRLIKRLQKEKEENIERERRRREDAILADHVAKIILQTIIDKNDEKEMSSKKSRVIKTPQVKIEREEEKEEVNEISRKSFLDSCSSELDGEKSLVQFSPPYSSPSHLHSLNSLSRSVSQGGSFRSSYRQDFKESQQQKADREEKTMKENKSIFVKKTIEQEVLTDRKVVDEKKEKEKESEPVEDRVRRLHLRLERERIKEKEQRLEAIEIVSEIQLIV